MPDPVAAIAAAAPDLFRSPAILAYVAAALFIAFVVRGFSGFGSSLIAISAISIVLPPAEIVPPIFAIEILSSISLLPTVWREVHWGSLRWISLGCAIATPLGLALLARLPVDAMRIAISVIVIILALALLRGAVPRASPGPAATVGVGMLVGLLNGAAGVGGPPAVLFYFSGPQSAAVGRASLIAFFLFTDVYAIAIAGSGGLIGGSALALFLLALPAVGAGLWVGNHLYGRADPASFRRWVLRLLVLLGLAGAIVAAIRLI